MFSLLREPELEVYFKIGETELHKEQAFFIQPIKNDLL